MNIVFSEYNPLSIIYSGVNTIFSGSNQINKQLKRPNNNDIEKYNLIIFDMDGVLRIGNKSIPIARESFNKLQKTKIPLCIITNECRRTGKRLKKELKQMGYRINNDIKIITSGDLMLKQILYILEMETSKRRINFGIISEQDFFFFIKHNSLNNYKNVKFHWIHDKIIPTNLDYIVIGCLNNKNKIENEVESTSELTSFNDNDILINRCINWFKNNDKFELLLTCPDEDDVENINKVTTILPKQLLKIIDKKDKNLKILDKNIIIPGKPNPIFILDILNDNYGLNINPFNESEKSKVLMVGDNINTDIELANNLDIESCLVLTGVTRYDDIINIQSEKLQNINYIVPDISYLVF